MNKNIPKEVVAKAIDLINLYGNTLKYIGEYNGCVAYRFGFPEHSETGFPVIYLHDSRSGEVMEVSGFDALDIICELVK